MSMSAFESLVEIPSEMLEKIVKWLDYRDICKLSSVNRRLQADCLSFNEVWRDKFAENWPLLHKRKYLRAPDPVDWRTQVKIRHLYGTNVRQCLYRLFRDNYRDIELSEDKFVHFAEYHEEQRHEHGRFFQIDELEKIINDDCPNDNLTNKYYAEKVVKSVKHEFCHRLWSDYLERERVRSQTGTQSTTLVDLEELPAEDIPGDLVHGALLISRWCQTHIDIDEDHERAQIGAIAFCAMNHLLQSHRSHSARHHEPFVLSNEEAKNLSTSLYSPVECRQILQAINAAMYEIPAQPFRGNTDFYYCSENSYLDRVISSKLGIPITMCILYQAVAAKCGVKTYPVNYPGHFLLAWKEHPEESQLFNRYTFVDPYSLGRMTGDPAAWFPVQNIGQNPQQVVIARPLLVFRRIASNLVEVGRQQESSNDGLVCLRNGLELMHIINPQETEPALLLCRVYIHQVVNQERVLELLMDIVERDPLARDVVTYLKEQVHTQLALRSTNTGPPLEAKVRAPGVHYCVGLVMRHKKYNYLCTIAAWDVKCTASKDWIYQMGVHTLSLKDEQPFYNVLVCDGSTRYAAQENLELATVDSSLISHCEIGHFFERFNGLFYELNELKRVQFPEDEQFRDQLVCNRGLANLITC